MPSIERARLVRISLLDEFSVVVQASMVPEHGSECLACGEEAPRMALEKLERWLDGHAGEPITVVVESTVSSIMTWTTRSSSLTLHWTATLLGRIWHPGFELSSRDEKAVEPLVEPHTKRARPAARSSHAERRPPCPFADTVRMFI
jgi:hypothetical protein